MATVAEQLLLAREAKSLTIYQVAEVTKIRTDHIRALEAGDFDAFSAPVYIRGFVRNYAGMLKLDVAAVMATLDAELSQTKKFRQPPSLMGKRRGVLDFLTLQLSKLNWRIARVALIVLVVIGLGIGVAFVLRHRQKVDPIAHLPPSVYKPTQPGTGQTLPVPAPRKP